MARDLDDCKGVKVEEEVERERQGSGEMVDQGKSAHTFHPLKAFNDFFF